MKKFGMSSKRKYKYIPTVEDLINKYKNPNKQEFLKSLEGQDYITSYCAFKQYFSLTEEQAYKEFTELGY